VRNGDSPIDRRPGEVRVTQLDHRFAPERGCLPIASTATIISAAAEQQQHDDDDQKQFHGTSPLMTPDDAARGVQCICLNR
jgi:hypothetical protein